jgi:hypothetical protein
MKHISALLLFSHFSSCEQSKSIAVTKSLDTLKLLHEIRMWTRVDGILWDISVVITFITSKQIQKKQFGLTGFSVNESYLSDLVFSQRRL